MIKAFIVLAFMAIIASINGQSPNAFNYQAILRNSDGTIKPNETVSVQISILQGEVNGSSVYLEVHNTQTNEFGLVNLVIGEGTTSDDLSTVDWASGPYFIEITVNGTLMGTSQLLSVPYALFASSGSEGPQGPQGEIGPIGPQGEPGVTPWTQDSKGITYMDGSVGIGISATSNKLHVHQEASNSEIGVSNNHPSNEANNIISFFEGTTKQASIIARGSGITGGPPNALNIYTYLNQAPITLGTYTGEKIRIQDNGNVGIGTYSPSEKLDINGNLRVQGDLIVEGAGGQEPVITVAELIDLLNQKEIIPNNFAGTVSDIDGNVYTTVQIGNQIWMAENLRTTVFPNGFPILIVEDSTEWVAMSDFNEACCWYENNPYYLKTFGVLYTWGAAMHGSESNNLNPSGIQGVCPDGWHLPSHAEWQVMEVHLGGEITDYYGLQTTGNVGGKLKESGFQTWLPPNTGGKNKSGFSALGAGYRHSMGYFNNIGERAAFWTTTRFAHEQDAPMNRFLYNDSDWIYHGHVLPNNGMSVRCVKDFP